MVSAFSTQNRHTLRRGRRKRFVVFAFATGAAAVPFSAAGVSTSASAASSASASGLSMVSSGISIVSWLISGLSSDISLLCKWVYLVFVGWWQIGHRLRSDAGNGNLFKPGPLTSGLIGASIEQLNVLAHDLDHGALLPAGLVYPGAGLQATVHGDEASLLGILRYELRRLPPDHDVEEVNIVIPLLVARETVDGQPKLRYRHAGGSVADFRIAR